MLIPVFNLGWQFYLLRAATKGIKGKLDELGRDSGDAGFGVGLAYQVLSCLAVVTNLGRQTGNDQTSKLADVFGLAMLVTWIIYWVRIAQFNREMSNPSSVPSPTLAP